MFKARFLDSHFFEDTYSKLHSDKQQGDSTQYIELQWQTPNTFWNDPRTQQSEEEVKHILYLTQMLERLSDEFNNAANVTRSHVEAANVSARLQKSTTITTEIQPRAKRGRPLGSKDTQPINRRNVGPSVPTMPQPMTVNMTMQSDNDKISLYYMHTGKTWS